MKPAIAPMNTSDPWVQNRDTEQGREARPFALRRGPRQRKEAPREVAMTARRRRIHRGEIGDARAAERGGVWGKQRRGKNNEERTATTREGSRKLSRGAGTENIKDRQQDEDCAPAWKSTLPAICNERRRKPGRDTGTGRRMATPKSKYSGSTFIPGRQTHRDPSLVTEEAAATNNDEA